MVNNTNAIINYDSALLYHICNTPNNVLMVINTFKNYRKYGDCGTETII